MKIRIISYEDLDAWICGKIARRLTDALTAQGHECTVGKTVDPDAEINHHVIYLNYPGHATGVHTLMVTHIDDILKLNRLKTGLKTARAGICVSSESCSHLAELGVNPPQLTYVNLAHDGNAIPRRFAVGITTRLYPDGRKREDHVLKLIEEISPEDFMFKIMGFGWQPIVERMRTRGFTVEYQPDFHYETYLHLMASLDYFMYLGKDEGSMGFIDALAAGVKTIVHPQGHHLDAINGITHPVKTYEDLRLVFVQIAAERHRLTRAVEHWTWANYARQHVAIWEKCKADLPANADLVSHQPKRLDLLSYFRLCTNVVFQKGRMILNLGKEYECGSRWWARRRR
jgi:hypothetical protein